MIILKVTKKTGLLPLSRKHIFGKLKTPIPSLFRIKRPSNLIARVLFWSNDNNNNSVKYLIGITPQDTICFLWKGLGGPTSDQPATENSGFLKYSGFNIVEIVGTYGVRLEILPFTNGKEHLRAE